MNLNEVFSSDVIRPLSSDHEVVSEVTTPWKQRVVLHICPSVSNRSAFVAKSVYFACETRHFCWRDYIICSLQHSVCTVHVPVYLSIEHLHHQLQCVIRDVCTQLVVARALVQCSLP